MILLIQNHLYFKEYIKINSILYSQKTYTKKQIIPLIIRDISILLFYNLVENDDDELINKRKVSE